MSALVLALMFALMLALMLALVLALMFRAFLHPRHGAQVELMFFRSDDYAGSGRVRCDAALRLGSA